MYKKVLLISIIALTLISPTRLAIGRVHANEATDNLKKRLQESLNSGKDDLPAGEADLRVASQSTPRAYIGIVKDMIKDTIIMQDKDGKKDIKLASDTTILRTPGNTLVKSENIRLDDYIIAIGYPGGDDIITGRRLILSVDPIKSPAKVSGFGTITKIGKNTLTLQVNDQEQILDLTAKTIFKSAAGSIEFTDLAPHDTLIYTAKSDSKENLTATIIMRIQTGSL